MYFIKNQTPLPLLIEPEAYAGVAKVSDILARDFETVCGQKPEIIHSPKQFSGEDLILCATLGHSPLVDQLVKDALLDVSDLQGKWECYLRTVIPAPFPGIRNLILICGSDKRGTIYGMFSLSEYLGVSPLCYWGDADPVPRSTVTIDSDWTMLSKEPSVKYRGFFINDEWPCFGLWTRDKFGDVNENAYDVIFEFLLRMKGNYLWPAMWCSNFPLDGPGSLNEELADLYGVVIGFSHHEPCLRSGGEFSLVKGKDSPYGEDWSFLTNREGITQFWRDGLLRSGKYENLITIGMRGENDSTILGDFSGLQENIDLLKDVITTQKKLITECVNPEKALPQQLLAIYKEVEPFFYGDETVPGLKDWDGLENVICMLCEDNYGFLRSLPTKELYEQITSRGGGFGMYYHLDYHGAPISYEWMPSTPLSKIWDQMCMAYDHGVRDVWIVNVGDLKGNVFELEYFLSLAYDYETWGSLAPGSWNQYLTQKLKQLFPATVPALRTQIQELYTSYMMIAGLRRPEAVNEGTFHPCHHLETDRLLERIQACDELARSIYLQLQNTPAASAYYSLFYYPEQATMNLYKMWLYTTKNHHYASQGRTIANHYADLVEKCMKWGKELDLKFADFQNGKWKGMELEAHIGLRTWNEDGCTYPTLHHVIPYDEPRLSVSRKDETATAIRAFGSPRQILIKDFLDERPNPVILELANTGLGELEYLIEGSVPWLEISSTQGCFTEIEEIVLTYHPELLPAELIRDHVTLTIRSSKSAVIVEHKADIEIVVTAGHPVGLPLSVHCPNQEIISIDASAYSAKKDTDNASYVILSEYGRSGSGVKVLPNTFCFTDSPSISYDFYVKEAGEYILELWFTPTNPIHYGTNQHLTIKVNDQSAQMLSILPDIYCAGDWRDPVWSKGVMDHIRKLPTTIFCKEGNNRLTLSTVEPGIVLEKLHLYRKENPPKTSYLGK